MFSRFLLVSDTSQYALTAAEPATDIAARFALLDGVMSANYQAPVKAATAGSVTYRAMGSGHCSFLAAR